MGLQMNKPELKKLLAIRKGEIEEEYQRRIKEFPGKEYRLYRSIMKENKLIRLNDLLFMEPYRSL
jgi:hypothetical protein